MSDRFKYQTAFASDLTAQWLAGRRSEVRITIRQLKNKAQAAYIAAAVATNLPSEQAGAFVNFMHPNN